MTHAVRLFETQLQLHLHNCDAVPGFHKTQRNATQRLAFSWCLAAPSRTAVHCQGRLENATKGASRVNPASAFFSFGL